MKTFIIIAASLLLLAFAAFNYKKEVFTRNDAKKLYANLFYPNIKFEQDTINMGTIINPPSTIKGFFKFKNSGRGNLLIEKIKPGCGCTAVSWTKHPVGHQETGVVNFEINPAEIDTGAFEKSMVVSTNGYLHEKILVVDGKYYKK